MITGYELYKTFPFGYNMKIIRPGRKHWVTKINPAAHPESNHPDDSKICWFWTEKSAMRYIDDLNNPPILKEPYKVVILRDPNV